MKELKHSFHLHKKGTFCNSFCSFKEILEYVRVVSHSRIVRKTKVYLKGGIKKLSHKFVTKKTSALFEGRGFYFKDCF